MTLTHNQRVLALLADGLPHSHHELYALHVIAHSRVNDLRAQGHRIDQWREGDLYLYRLVDGAGPQVAVVAGTPQTVEAGQSRFGSLPGSVSEPVQLQLVPERYGAYHGGVCT